jgi:hypothetical protein
MEKLFWGMVGTCTLVFAVLLGSYLNKVGVIGSSSDSTAEISTQTNESETDTSYAEGELPEDIRSLLADSQGGYADAMKVFEEESAATHIF